MKRIIITATIVLIALFKVNAQAPVEVVYLKNGSIIRGVVLEQIPSESIKLQTADGSIFVYSMDEVEKITKDFQQQQQQQRPIKSRSLRTFDLEGYRGFVDIGYLVDTGKLKADRLEVSTTHGYQFNNHIFMGVGVGMHYYTDGDIFMLPIYANFRGYLLDNYISPYLDLRAGYSPVLSDVGDDKGGLYIAPTIGVRILMPNQLGFNFGVGFNLQRFKDNTFFDESFSMNAISIKLGIEF